ncbi:aminopeptidase I zinc metalloprotease family protein [Mycobacterium xenopi 3993]|nr:aminopeptidase I zinc metalloprotease family protein [Mycobacterium xenopi 3993]
MAGGRAAALRGAWLNSWLDRDLGISGRLSVRDGAGVSHRLVRIDDPILRVPQLAIHLAEDRKSLTLDPQHHVNAVWAAGDSTRSFVGYVAERAGVGADDVLGFDLMTHDLAPSTLAGVDDQFLSAPRLDNQASCYAGLEALLAAEPDRYLPVLVLFDHEEVGSSSDHGAQSELLLTTLERVVLAAGGDREDFLRRMAGSMMASADMAHATHPNYPDRHEPGHPVTINGARCSRCNPTCGMPPTGAPLRPSHSPADRPAWRCSDTNTAPTYHAVRRSARSPRHAPASRPWTSALPNWRCTPPAN